MDARIQKTRKSIIDAYIFLKKKDFENEPLVRDVCEKAHVNKTTFYRHFKDIDTLRKEVIIHLSDEIVKDWENVRLNELSINSTRDYVYCWFEVAERHQPEISPFHRHIIDFASIFRRIISDSYKNKYEKEINPIILDFLVGGFTGIFYNNPLSSNDLIEAIVKVMERIIPIMD